MKVREKTVLGKVVSVSIVALMVLAVFAVLPNIYAIPCAGVTMTVSYSIVNTPAGTGYSAPYFNYVFGGHGANVQLTTTGNALCVDSGSTWVLSQTPESSGGYASTLLAGSGATCPPTPGICQQWATTTDAGTSAAGTFNFPYYHQFLQTLSYLVLYGGTLPTNPTFTANQYGSSAPQTVTTTAVGYWYDAGSSWSFSPNPIPGAAGEQWTIATSSGVTGTITTSAVYTIGEVHQYYLTMVANPASDGSVSASGWVHAGKTVTVYAHPNAGHKLLSWTGVGAGSYSGAPPASLTMNGPITETANFT